MVVRELLAHGILPKAMNFSELCCIANAIFEKRQTAACCLASCPAWVLLGENMILRVRHQAENVAAFVADTGDIGYGTVRVVGISVWLTSLIHISERNLLSLLQRGQNLIVARDEAALAMSDRTVYEIGQALSKHARAVRVGFEIDPAAFKSVGSIAGQRC